MERRSLRLPDPSIAEQLRVIQRNAIGTQHSAVAGLELDYTIFRADPGSPSLGACYDEDGTVYIPEALVQADKRHADLIAFHEHAEIRHKRAGRSHAYAHRHALVEEFLTAKQIHDERSALKRYLVWRVKGYPASKIPYPEEVAVQLAHILAADRPRKGDLLKLITNHRM
jgi:hypothetical protein